MQSRLEIRAKAMELALRHFKDLGYDRICSNFSIKEVIEKAKEIEKYLASPVEGEFSPTVPFYSFPNNNPPISVPSVFTVPAWPGNMTAASSFKVNSANDVNVSCNVAGCNCQTCECKNVGC